MPFVSLSRYSRPLLLLILIVSGSVILSNCRAGSSPEQYLSRAKKLIDQKQYDRALLELKNAARANPKNAEPYYQAGLAYLALGDYRMAYQSLLRATDLDPKHVGAQTKLAEIIGSSVANTRDPQALKEAEQRVQSVLAIVPNSGEALGALGLTEYLLGKPEDATKHLEIALEKVPQNLQASRSLAMIKIRQKDFTGAEQILKKAAADSPKSASAQLALAEFFIVAQRPTDADAAYHQALNIDPNDGPALLGLARLQFSLGKKDEAEKTLIALSALPDREYKPLHAIYLFDQGRQDEAIKEFERQAAQDSKDRLAFTRLVSAYFVVKRFPEAERAVNIALKRNPKDVTALLEQSKLYLITAKFSEAETDLNQVLKSDPNSATAYYLLSKVYMARGQQLPARQQLGKALDFEPNLLAARLELARSLTAGGASKASLDLLDQASEKQRSLLPVIVERNWALFRARDHMELRRTINRGLAIYKRAPDLVLQDGLLKLQTKDLGGARKSLEEVLVVRPEDTDALDALAKTYVFQKQPDLALRTVQQYAARRPNSGPLQHLLGNWLATNKRREDARRAYAAALAADPSLVGTRMSLALLDAQEGKFDSARQTLAVLAQTPGMQERGEMMLGTIEEKMGNPPAAISHYRKVVEADPNNFQALNNLAYLLADHTDALDEALKFAQQAKELDPNSGIVEDTIGWAFYRKGLYDSALIHLRIAATKEPGAVLKYHLAMAYLKTGDRQRGRQVLEQARKTDPALPEASAASQLIMNSSGTN
jgi:tetratricopeptide (TPR) repeat protein